MTLFYCWSERRENAGVAASFGLQRGSQSAPPYVWFQCGCFLSHQCTAVTQLVSGSLSKDIASCVAIYLVCPWEEGNSGASYVSIFVKSSQHCDTQKAHRRQYSFCIGHLAQGSPGKQSEGRNADGGLVVRAVELPCPLWALLSQRLHLFTDPEALCYTVLIFFLF